MSANVKRSHCTEAALILVAGLASCCGVFSLSLPWSVASSLFGFGAFSMNAGILILLVDRILKGGGGAGAMTLSVLFLLKLVFIGVVSYVGVSLLKVSVVYMVAGALLSLAAISLWMYLSWVTPRPIAHS